MESCYVERLDRAQHGIAAVRTWYGISDEYKVCLPLQQVRQEELQNLLRKCLSLQSKLQETYQYGYLNRQGFCRIFDKLTHVGAEHRDVFGPDNPTAPSFMI